MRPARRPTPVQAVHDGGSRDGSSRHSQPEARPSQSGATGCLPRRSPHQRSICSRRSGAGNGPGSWSLWPACWPWQRRRGHRRGVCRLPAPAPCTSATPTSGCWSPSVRSWRRWRPCPFGVMADRFRRTRTLGLADRGLGRGHAVERHGVVLRQAAPRPPGPRRGHRGRGRPIVASLVGDYFEGSERGRIYSYILTGELLGAGARLRRDRRHGRLVLAGVLRASRPAGLRRWRWVVLRLPEPDRGGRSPRSFRRAPSARLRGAGRAGRREDDTAPTPDRRPADRREPRCAARSRQDPGLGPAGLEVVQLDRRRPGRC